MGSPRTDGPPRPRPLAAVAMAAVAVMVAALAPGPAGAAGPAPFAFAPPSSVGPFRVGRETITVRSKDGRRVRTVDVWYPADLSARGRPTRYLEPTFPTIGYNSHVALDRVPASKDGPFPLVVYSHGSGGLRFIATWFTEVLASHGFVVISADHVGDTVMDIFHGVVPSASDGPRVIADRVADVRLAVDSVVKRSATRGDLLAGTVDPNRIAITGHSYGGLTAFAAVGGINPNPGGPIIGRDRRFKAVVTMEATPQFMSQQDMQNVRVPVLSIGGSTYVRDFASYWHTTRAHPFLEVSLAQASHNEFTDICHYQQLESVTPAAPPVVVSYINSVADAACPPPNMPVSRVHAYTNRYAIAFLETYLAGDHRYQPYLHTPPGAPDVHVTAPTLQTPVPTSVPLVLD